MEDKILSLSPIKLQEYSFPSFVFTLIVMSMLSMGEYTGIIDHGQWKSKYKGGNKCDCERIGNHEPLTMERIVYYKRTIHTK